MLPTIVFVFSLFLSIGYIEMEINRVINMNESHWLDVIIVAVICLMWGWLYWLSH
jgi:fumarate reductase subunit D